MRPNILKDLSKQIENLKRKNLGEAATKSVLIQPLLEEIGWNFKDIDCIEPEFPVFLDGENRPADYALKIDRKVCLFLEAKRINEKIDVAIKDGSEKAIEENVPWLIATNGDAIAVLMIDKSIPEEERMVFQTTLSDSVMGEQSLKQFIARLNLLSPGNIQTGGLEEFAKQKLKETRITNVLKNTLSSDEFKELIQENFRAIYMDDQLDRDVLDAIIEKIRVGDKSVPVSIQGAFRFCRGPYILFLHRACFPGFPNARTGAGY